MSVFEIPVTAANQSVTIRLDGTDYILRWVWRDEASAWALDVSDSGGAPIVRGIPILPGLDLLGPYRHLGFVGKLYVQSEGDPLQEITYDGFGTVHKLYYVSAQ